MASNSARRSAGNEILHVSPFTMKRYDAAAALRRKGDGAEAEQKDNIAPSSSFPMEPAFIMELEMPRAEWTSLLGGRTNNVVDSGGGRRRRRRTCSTRTTASGVPARPQSVPPHPAGWRATGDRN